MATPHKRAIASAVDLAACQLEGVGSASAPVPQGELDRWAAEAAGLILWTADLDGSCASIAPNGLGLGSISEDKVQSHGWTGLVHPQDRERVEAAWAHSVATGEALRVECRLANKDGSAVSMLVRAQLKPAAGGTQVRWFGMMQEIAVRGAGGENPGSVAERYRLAMDAASEILWDTDVISNLVTWNEAARRLIGSDTTPLQTTKAWWEERVHPGDRARVLSSLRAAIEGDATEWSANYRFRTPDRDHVVIAERGFIIRDESGRAVRAVGAMVDVTERQKAELKLQQAQSELIQVSRVSAMATMASTLAHELNQPLISIANYVRGSRLRLEQAMETPAEVTEALDAAEREVTRAGHIVTHLRKFVRTGKVDRKREDLAMLIEEASGLAFLDIGPRRITWDLELDPSARWAMVDGIQVQQVVINLARNAIDAVQESVRREIVISARAACPKWIEVSVSDTGIGLSNQVRETIFTPFQTTKPNGLGLGLSICRTIVEAHGGKIWADAVDGGGTVFTLTLPRPDEPAAL